MNGIKDTENETPILKNDEKMYVYLKGSHFQQNNVLTPNNDHIINDNIVNIYIVYKLDPITSRDTTFTIQMLYLELCKLLNYLELCKLIIFGVDTSFSKHAINKRNNIYVMGKDYV